MTLLRVDMLNVFVWNGCKNLNDCIKERQNALKKKKKRQQTVLSLEMYTILWLLNIPWKALYRICEIQYVCDRYDYLWDDNIRCADERENLKYLNECNTSSLGLHYVFFNIDFIFTNIWRHFIRIFQLKYIYLKCICELENLIRIPKIVVIFWTNIHEKRFW